MEVKRLVAIWITLSLLICKSTTESLEEVDSITDDPLLLLTTTELPITQTDNGMTLGEIPDLLTTGNIIHNIETNSETEVLGHPTPSTLLTPAIPENHKNYTGSPFVDSIELPPLLNQFNAYQQQYKTYYDQKSEYELKPGKFEVNSGKNRYVTQGLGSYLEDTDARHRYEELKFSKEPFPYTYESERIPFISQSVWSEYNDPVRNEVDDYDGYKYEKPEVAFKDDYKELYGWKKALKFFTVLVPLGLLLATFTPSVISINSTVDQKPSRQRSLNQTGDDIAEYMKLVHGLNATDNRECEFAEICRLSRLGKEDSGEEELKSLWHLANEAPDDVAERFGLKDLFRAIRENKCELYKCRRKRKGNKRGKKKAADRFPGKNR